MGYVPSRPPPRRGIETDPFFLANLPWNRGLNPLLHTPTPGTLSFQQAIDSMRWLYGTPAYVYGVPVSAQATADAVGCRYCGRRKSGTATCAGCGAPS